MPKYLVIVESPAKAKTLKKFLGSSYKIEASVGHVRDLPKSELGINIQNDFEPKYITIRGKGEILSQLRKEVKKVDKVFLATDPDREGEAISWHLMHALKLDEKHAQRITFNEITKTAVKKSIKEARSINMNLVDAQQARRELDRIVGYMISPLLWKKVRKGLSAGRVQSVALKLICDRESEIQSFIPDEYWTIEAVLKSDNNLITVKFYGTEDSKIELGSREAVDEILKKIKDAPFVVTDIKKGERTKKPSAPFTTSTLQQEASKLLGFPTQKTMSLAQQLYEGVEVAGEGSVGLLSYIRTDSSRISDEAYDSVKDFIVTSYGEPFLNPKRPVYKQTSRAQDAHEAIRPTLVTRKPDDLKNSLSKDQYKLYKLVWERFVASQMAVAVYDTVSAKISANEYIFRGSGSTLKFEGYLTVYKKNEEQEQDYVFPELEVGKALSVESISEEQHFTQPPAHYSEALLVKTLEEEGVGRPSTYAQTISNLLARGYISREAKILYPTELGEIVNDIMKANFEDIVDIGFTAKMEDDLDKVEDGDLQWKEILRQFYSPFEEKIKLADEKIGNIEIKDEVTDQICENCGRNMVIKFGRFGKYLACPGFPDCKNSKSFFEDIFALCGYASTYVYARDLCKNKEMYVATLISYIDKGIPIISMGHGGPPFGVFVGYEEYGKTLLYITGNGNVPERISIEKAMESEQPDVSG